MRIIVTGGAGFIGSHLVERLLADGNVVIGLDRAGYLTTLHPDYWPVVADLRDMDDWWQGVKYGFGTLAQGTPDFIYHLASTVGVANVLADPAECIDNIVNSTKAVLSLGIPGIYFSTSEVYGKGESGEASGEGADLVLSRKARWAYAAAKMCGEWMALQAGWKVIRPFNVVGPHQNTAYGAVLPRFVRQATTGEPITVYGDGSQVRTFIDVRDFVEILVRVQDTNFDILNIGGDEVFNIEHLAHFVKGHFHSSSIITHVPYQKAYQQGFEECQERVPNLEKLEALIGKYRFRPFGETLDSIAEDLQENNHVRCETQAAQL